MLYLFAALTLMMFAWLIVAYLICMLTPWWRDAWAKGDGFGAFKIMFAAFVAFVLLVFYEVMMASTLF